MADLLTVAAPAGTSGYTLMIAAGPDQVAAAQRLRHEVFAGELGARLHSPVDGLDVDEFDEFFDHLVVRDDATGAVVGTYRLMRPGGAARAGRRYGDTEFDLNALWPLRDQLVEAGRSCVHPDHRSGAVVNLIWSGIVRYLHLHNTNWLGGCASIALDDGGRTAAGVWTKAQQKHLAPPSLRVRPRRPWLAGPGVEASGERVVVPPLLRSYLRLGAWVCGPPAHDPDFRTADFYLLTSMDRLDPRYRRHFLGATR
jgi:putative hemolysin